MVALSASLPDFSGQIIDNGRFHLINTVGSGAYGVVYRALDTTSDPCNPMFYAIKCLQKADLSPYQLAFQAREIAIHKTVTGAPHVLSLHEVIEEELYLYFVLDLCTGGDLFGAITQRNLFLHNDELTRKAFIELIDGLQACHDRGIFHRDLKPENILCQKDGTGILIADFGLATRKRVSRDFGCGSSYYMSPECIGKQFNFPSYSTQESDVWSLGVILTNMISGRNPWRFATLTDECFATYLHNPDFLHEMLPISDGASEILKRIFTLNPHIRITLPELREAILELDTFYMSEEEISRAPDHIQDAVAYAKGGHPDTKVTVHEVISDSTLTGASSSSSSSDEFSNSSFNANDEYMYTSRGVVEHSRQRDSREPKVTVRLVVRNHRPEDFSLGSASSSSGEESDGPITPETYASDPDIDVPDLAEGETLDEAIIKPEIASPPIKQPRNPSRILRNAVQRLRAL